MLYTPLRTRVEIFPWVNNCWAKFNLLDVTHLWSSGFLELRNWTFHLWTFFLSVRELGVLFKLKSWKQSKKWGANIPRAFELKPQDFSQVSFKTAACDGRPASVDSEWRWEISWHGKSHLSIPAMFGVGAPEQRDTETDLSSAGLAVCLQQDQDKLAAFISGNEMKHFKWKYKQLWNFAQLMQTWE